MPLFRLLFLACTVTVASEASTVVFSADGREASPLSSIFIGILLPIASRVRQRRNGS